MTIRIAYSVLRGGSRYWQLGEERAAGTGVPAYEALGPEGEEAQKRALSLYAAYKKAKKGETAEDKTGGYPPGSLGAFYTAWKKTPDFTDDKSERTQDEYDDVWTRRIAPEFGRTLLGRITVADSETFHRRIKRELSPSEAHRTLKIWRALLSVLEKKHLVDRAPIGAVTNPMPAGRGQFWLEHEIQRMLRACRLMKWDAMGLLIRLAWETAMSPVDCRTFSLSMLKEDRKGHYIERQRTKTKKGAMPVISDQLAADLKAYAKSLNIDLLPGQPLFRNSKGRIYTKEYLAHEFADVRRVTFGKLERRQFLDIRRSANLEADLGGATAEDRAAVLANALDKNPTLDATYTPSTVTRGRRVQEAREQGRQLLAQELGRKAK